jgi:putative peptidoglycan lipid II flippase
MAAALWLASGGDAAWIAMDGAVRAASLVWTVALGAVTYFAALWLLGFRLRDFAKRGVE